MSLTSGCVILRRRYGWSMKVAPLSVHMSATRKLLPLNFSISNSSMASDTLERRSGKPSGSAWRREASHER